jgi:L-ascorbate 6-phosphate lactonase
MRANTLRRRNSLRRKAMGTLKILENSIPASLSTTENREMTRDIWLREVFPEWKSMLNMEIEKTEVKAGSFAMWFLGGPSWAYKSPEGFTALIDNYSGSSLNSEEEYCGVCRTSGATYLPWLRTNPHVIDPWKFTKLDVAFSTHHHQDHADQYTVKGTLDSTQCKYVGPANTVPRFREWGVPEDRIIQVKPGDSFTVKDVTVIVEKNYDNMAAMTGDYNPNKPIDYDANAVSYILVCGDKSMIYLGDSLYHNGYYAVGRRHSIDVCIGDMGYNAPGIADKMNPYDLFRVAEALGAKVVIPDHYENWASSVLDPMELVEIIRMNRSSLKPVIMRSGGKFVYPEDRDMLVYKYPDNSERFNWKKSWVYGDGGK